MIELLVAITIIAVLMALLLPAVMSARATARRTQCKSNLRNLGLAMMQSAEANRRFPAAGYFGKTTGNYHNWVLELLPYVEQRGVIADSTRYTSPSLSITPPRKFSHTTSETRQRS